MSEQQSESEINRLKTIACSAIDENAAELNSISQAIWQNPELAYEEHQAHNLLSDFFLSRNFVVSRIIYL